GGDSGPQGRSSEPWWPWPPGSTDGSDHAGIWHKSMNSRRPFVVLPFPPRGQALVSSRETRTAMNGRIAETVIRPVVKRNRPVRFFQDIHGLVHNGPPSAPEIVACCTCRGVPATQMVR